MPLDVDQFIICSIKESTWKMNASFYVVIPHSPRTILRHLVLGARRSL